RREGRLRAAPGHLPPVPRELRPVSRDSRQPIETEKESPSQLSAGHPAADQRPLARPLLRQALAAVRTHPLRGDLAGDDPGDARLLHPLPAGLPHHGHPGALTVAHRLRSCSAFFLKSSSTARSSACAAWTLAASLVRRACAMSIQDRSRSVAYSR